MNIRQLFSSALLSMTIVLPLTGNAAAPSTCPSAEELIKGGFETVEYLPDYRSYAANNKGTFNTDMIWGFVVAVPEDQAVDKADAKNKALAALATLKGNPKPFYSDEHWFCVYSNNYGYMSIAGTPIEE